MNELDRWVEAATAALGLPADEVRTPMVLDLARDVAHQVVRPGAPVTAYLLGLAVGRGADPAEAAAVLGALAASWPSRAGSTLTRQDPPTP
ncbi:DUF6457 domain-containing protein [Mangrovihabitans endophyticus]|uniref:DUF6457 domain-containing protein n=1 Tax=Mangrovihabitans endophyticus TaxID=1751298 RepID=A0A8J3C133_9ACTN|nr:DUF6457 domain-containing protein [Mangrovihabitans endophyticus]GGK93721.1 hypothetical protein GCM10012284_29590 [Mangrovihabitans endophyticus]